MDRGDHQFHRGHSEGQVQTGFDTFVMTGDMIIKTTPKSGAPSGRSKPEKPTSAVVQISEHTSTDKSLADLQQMSLNGSVEVPSSVSSQVKVAGCPRFPDTLVELDIPPDDISSEDERYRIDCLEDLDVTNLPPPPAEFLGDFSDACPTSALSGTIATEDGAPVSGLLGGVGQSGKCRNSLDEAIMRLESQTASSDIWISQEDPSRHAVHVSSEKVSSTGRANSSGSLVSAGAGVRASKSQDNWLQHGGSDVGFVNIDVDGPSMSVEALHSDLPRSSLNNLDALRLQTKSGEAPLLSQSADDVRRRDASVSDNSKLSTNSAAERTNFIDSVHDPVVHQGAQSLVEPSACCHDSSSPEHAFEGFEEPRPSSSRQRLLGGGKSSPVRRPPAFQNGTNSSGEFNHHPPASWNNVADAGRPQLKDIDHPSACRLAKRLYHLDGFRKSDVCKHLSKRYVHFLVVNRHV